MLFYNETLESTRLTLSLTKLPIKSLRSTLKQEQAYIMSRFSKEISNIKEAKEKKKNL